MPADFVDTFQMPERVGAIVKPIRFSGPKAASDAFARRAQRIQAEAERVQTLIRTSRTDGFNNGFQSGYERGGRIGFYLGITVATLGCIFIAWAR